MPGDDFNPIGGDPSGDQKGGLATSIAGGSSLAGDSLLGPTDLFTDGTTGGYQLVGKTRGARKASITGILNLGKLGERLTLEIDGLDEVTCQVECISGAFPAATLTQKYSNDGYRFDAITGAATVTADGVTAQVNVTAYKLYALEVTTAATGRATVAINAKSTS